MTEQLECIVKIDSSLSLISTGKEGVLLECIVKIDSSLSKESDNRFWKTLECIVKIDSSLSISCFLYRELRLSVL